MFGLRTSGFDDVLAFNDAVFDDLDDPDKILRAAIFNLYAEISARIQQRGEKSDGTPIGDGKGYSTKAFTRFGSAFDFEGIATKAQKKARLANENDFETFDGGYKEYRESLGRQTRFIDLTLTGEMMDRSFTAGPIGGGAFGIGFLSRLGADRMERNEQRYGGILDPTDAEQQTVRNLINQAVRDAFRR
jgi:hypothetical protein